MKILACGVVYNEMDILPYLLSHYKSQGIGVFIFDNFSDDGTWEYLQDNKIACERVSSDGKMSTIQFFKKMTAKWDEMKPDWCIYLDADEFPLTFQFSSLKELIEDRNRKGFNIIKQTRVNFRPTGLEDFSKGDPREVYRYYFINFPGGKGHPQCERIIKYFNEINLVKKAGHSIEGLDKKVSMEPLDNPIFHYSMRENAREKTLQRFNRRNKDEETVKLNWNTHYKKYIEKNVWVWNKDELSDMKDPEDIFYKIQNKENIETKR